MKRRSWAGAARVGGCSAAALVVAGCAVVTELQNKLVEAVISERQPRTQAEAASTHLAVVAVARWDEYVQEIQPAFKLTAEEALDQAIPTTASYQSRLVEAYRLGLAAGLPQTGVTETRTEATDATGATTETANRETRTTPGVAPTLPPFLGSVAGSGTLSFPTADLDDDPFLRYSVASDLYQEVKLLNRALTSSIVRDQVEPYLIRLKIAALPYRRELEADAYSDLSFFIRSPGSSRPSGVIELPVVVPLLVTDNLESATDAASAQYIAALSAAVTGSAQGAALSGQLESLGDRLTAALANERNALRTVARLGENAIRVRLGATFQAGPTGRKAYGLLPRTHTVSLLVLAPRGAMKTDEPLPLGIVVQTRLKQVDDGDPIALSNRDLFDAKLGDMARVFKIDQRIANGGRNCPKIDNKLNDQDAAWRWINHLRFQYVVYGDYPGFFEQVRCMETNGRDKPNDGKHEPLGIIEKQEIDSDAESLWQALLTFTGDYGVHGQTVHLPAVSTPALPDVGPTVILVDDGKSASVVRVPGGGGLVPARLRAELQWDGDVNRLAADMVAIDDVGVRASFPSLQKLGLAADGKTRHAWRVVLSHPVASTDQAEVSTILATSRPTQEQIERLAGVCGKKGLFDRVAGRCQASYGSVRYVAGDPRPKAPGKVEAAIAADRLVAVTGQGSVTVGIKLEPGVPARAAYVQVGGAEIEAANGGELDELGRLKLAASGRVTITLRNAAPGGKVSVTVGLLGADGKPEGLPINKVLEVVEGQPKVQAGGGGRPAT